MEGLGEVLRYGWQGLAILLLVGVAYGLRRSGAALWVLSERIFERWSTAEDAKSRTLQAIADQITGAEARAAERHDVLLSEIREHREAVRIALAEARGEHRAEEEQAERPTPAAGVPLLARGR